MACLITPWNYPLLMVSSSIGCLCMQPAPAVWWQGCMPSSEHCTDNLISIQRLRHSVLSAGQQLCSSSLVSLWCVQAIWKVAPALAAGNTCVLKPSEIASVTCLELGDIVTEAKLPPGVLNIITGLGTAAGAPLRRAPGLAQARVRRTMLRVRAQLCAGLSKGKLVESHLQLHKISAHVQELTDCLCAARIQACTRWPSRAAWPQDVQSTSQVRSMQCIAAARM